MSQTVEVTGRTLEEAKRAAAEALGVSVDECRFEVLEESSKGLFAKSNYRVKASVAAGPPEKAAVDIPAETPEPKAPRAPRERKPKAKPDSEPTDEAAPDQIIADVTATEQDGQSASELLNGLFTAGEFDLTAKVDGLSGRYVNLSLAGEDAEAIVGDRGATIDALQYLGNAMLGRQLANGVRLTLDARDYRSQRAAQLEKLASDIASEVVKRSQEAVLDALPAHERRVIHNALRDVEGVETYSEGEEPMRRVVISPKK